MTPLEIAQLANIILPHLFAGIANLQAKNPALTYREALVQAGVKLDAEYIQLLADMAKAVEEGAVPR